MHSLVMFNEGILSESLEMVRFDSMDEQNCFDEKMCEEESIMLDALMGS